MDVEKMKASARRMNINDEKVVTSCIDDMKNMLDDGRKDRASI